MTVLLIQLGVDILEIGMQCLPWVFIGVFYAYGI
jgi:hypothetical protein